MSSYIVRFLAVLALALPLQVLAAAGAVENITLTKFPGGNNESHRVVVQPDGKVILAGSARMGTLQFSATRYNANGTLDATFGDSGSLIEPIGPGNAEAWAAVLQPDGKLLMAGYAESDLRRFALARFNADGTFDILLSGGGTVTQFGTQASEARAMALQPDGKIVLGGYAMSGTKKVAALARYNADGTLDTTFGSGGRVTRAAGASDEIIHALAIQADGKIVAAGDGGASSTLTLRFSSNGTPDTSWNGNGANYIAGISKGRDIVVRTDGKILIAGTVSATQMGAARLTTGGVLDTTFGTGGIAAATVGNNAQGYGLVSQPDDKVVVSGSGESSPGHGVVAVARFSSAGVLDATFGTSGVKTATTTTNDVGYGLARRADGSLIVAGRGDGLGYDSLATVLTAAGALDSTFNGTGFRLLDLGSRKAEARASVLQPDGKLVVAGYVQNEAQMGGQNAVVARYLADDTLDPTFGTGGFVTFGHYATAVALQSDGKIVVGGYSLVNQGGSDVPAATFARLTTAGALDATFGTGGIAVVTPVGSEEQINAIAIQSDGRIVGAGYIINGIFLDSFYVRLTNTGALDSTFDSDGRVTVQMSGGTNLVSALALQPDGKIVGAGRALITSSRSDFALARLNTNGSLDTSFGSGGIVTTTILTGDSRASALTLQSDGKIVAGGQVFNGTTDDFALVRYQTNGALDTTFGSGGKAVNDFGNHNRDFGLALMGNGQFVAVGETGGQFGVARYFPSGALDTFFGNGGSTSFVVNAGADYANAVTIGLDGKLHVSGNGSGLFAIARLSNDVPDPSSSANLSITQSSSVNPASTGKDVVFTLTVNNAGPAAATNVTVADTLPAGWTFVWASPGCNNASGTVTCTRSSLANGASATFKVVGRPVSAGSATNNASVASSQFDANTANNSSTATLTVNTSAAGTPVIRYRLYSPVTQEHLFTTDKNEYDTLGAQSGNWTQEGQAGKVLNNPGSFNGVTAVPYYRLYNTVSRWHHWTTDANEYYTLIQGPPFSAEGVDGYLLPTNTTGATQLYRLLYPDGRGLHHWTIDAVEYNQLITNYGWIGEGGSGFVVQ